MLTALALLPGCKRWFDEKFGCKKCDETSSTVMPTRDKKIGGEEIVVTIDGKPAVTSKDFDMSFQMLMQSQQGLMQVLPMMPEDQVLQLFKQMAENLAAERVAVEWIRREGIDKTEEYQTNAKLIHEAVDRDLAARAFQSELLKKIQINDEDARRFYEKNRDTNPYLKRSPFVSGTLSAQVSSVAFSDEKKAQDFFAKAKKGNFAQVAKDAKLTVKDHGFINAQSDVDNAIKAKALNAKQTPIVEMAKGLDGKFYVMYVTNKQEPKAVAFDQVKDKVKELMLAERFQELYQKEVEKLKKSYGVSINHDYIKKIVSEIKPAQMAEPEQTAQPEKAVKPLTA